MTWTFATANSNLTTTYPYTTSILSTDYTGTSNTSGHYDDWRTTSQTAHTMSQTSLTYIVPYMITYQRAYEIRYDAEELEQGLSRELGHEQGLNQELGHEQGLNQELGHEQGLNQELGHRQELSQELGHRQELSQEQRHEEELRRQESIKRQKADIEAKERARILLLEYLDNDNKRRLLDNKPLEIPSKLFNDIKYHIPISYDRIKAWKNNKTIAELCLSVKAHDLPLEDVILTKLLYMSHDEENAIRTARHWQVQESLLARLDQILN